MPHLPSQGPRTVTAPPPSPASMKSLPNRIFSVVLKPDEDVVWEWTHTPDGISYVTGYTLLKKPQ